MWDVGWVLRDEARVEGLALQEGYEICCDNTASFKVCPNLVLEKMIHVCTFGMIIHWLALEVWLCRK